MIALQTATTNNHLLKPFIESYAALSLTDPSVREKALLPWPGSSWLFLNQPFYIDHEKFEAPCLLGIRDRPSQLQWQLANLESFSIKLTPWGVKQFVNIPIHEIKNSAIDSPVIGKEMFNLQALHEKIITAPSLASKITAIEETLVKHLYQTSRIEKQIFCLANQIKNDPSLNTLLLKKSIPLSTRQLERKFKKLIGVNLQTFVRICRFDHAKTSLLQQRNSKLSYVGYDAGYFDQAHFSREFKNLSSQLPKNFPARSPFYQLLAHIKD